MAASHIVQLLRSGFRGPGSRAPRFAVRVFLVDYLFYNVNFSIFSKSLFYTINFSKNKIYFFYKRNL